MMESNTDHLLRRITSKEFVSGDAASGPSRSRNKFKQTLKKLSSKLYFFTVFPHVRARRKQNFNVPVVLVLYALLLIPEAYAFCPPSCQCDDLKLNAQCVRARLDIVPILLHPGMKHLDLSHNHIKNLVPGFSVYDQLTYLDLSYNEIASVGVDQFALNIHLQTLRLRNNKVSHIENRAFDGLANLTDLDISNNYINSFSDNSFRSLLNLRVLDLSNNRIENLTEYTFTKLRNLKILNLCKNNLKANAEEVFSHLRELQELHLCSNSLTYINSFVFRSLKHLTHLSLYKNKISVIQEKAFAGVEQLILMDLHDNSLGAVPTKSLIYLRSIEELNLSLNPINIIPSQAFSQLESLKTLYISHLGNLTDVSNEAFRSLKNLVTLEISFNPFLSTLPPSLFKSLSRLQRLVLRGNGLSFVNEDVFDWSSLQYLDLRDNRIECNCSVKWMRRLQLNKSLSLKVEPIVCFLPERLRNQRISELSEYDLHCYSKIVIIVLFTSAIVLLAITCAVVLAIYYKRCRKVKTLVPDNWPEKIVATWRDPEYEKQLEDQDDFTFQSSSNGYHRPFTIL